MIARAHPLRLGLVGLGGHGRTICDAAEASPSIDVQAVFDTDRRLADETAVRFRCPVPESYEAMIVMEELEAVALVTPNHLHLPQAAAALQRGLHVFVEKPVANTVDEGLAMVRAAAMADRQLMVGHNMRFAPAVGMVRSALADRRIGEPVSVEMHFSADSIQRLDADAWRLQPHQCPLLPVMQLGVHGIDLIHYCLDQIVQVHAFTRSLAAPPGVVDSVVATFRLASGVTGTFVSNYCSQTLFQYQITGTKGTIRGTPHRFWYRSNADTDGHGDGPAEEHDFSHRDRESYSRQFGQFAASVRTGAPLHPDGWDGLRALAVVEALHRSSMQGQPSPVATFDEQPAGQ